MLTVSHMKLAKHIYHMLKKEYGIVLNKKNLIYGSVKPDFVKNKVPHYIDKSIAYIDNEVERLINDYKIISKKKFSRRLGMIMHYISDYFCRAHNTEYYRKNIVAHLKYEKGLAKIIKFNKLNNNNKHESDFVLFKEYIIELNREYMQEKSLERDLEYTLKAIDSVTRYILSKIEANKYLKVA